MWGIKQTIGDMDSAEITAGDDVYSRIICGLACEWMEYLLSVSRDEHCNKFGRRNVGRMLTSLLCILLL